jgi:hypothetical protein
MAIERAGASNSKAARVARSLLDEFLGSAVCYLLGIALRKRDSIAKQWAAQFLEKLKVSLEKHHEKLSANPVSRETHAKLRKLRSDVLFPKSPIAQAVQRELKKAECHRRSLLLFRGVLKTRPLGIQWWKKVAQRNGISQEYFVTVKLPEFSMKSEPEWWKFLWPRIQKKIDPTKYSPLSQHDPMKGGVKTERAIALIFKKHVAVT